MVQVALLTLRLTRSSPPFWGLRSKCLAILVPPRWGKSSLVRTNEQWLSYQHTCITSTIAWLVQIFSNAPWENQSSNKQTGLSPSRKLLQESHLDMIRQAIHQLLSTQWTHRRKSWPSRSCSPNSATLQQTRQKRIVNVHGMSPQSTPMATRAAAMKKMSISDQAILHL